MTAKRPAVMSDQIMNTVADMMDWYVGISTNVEAFVEQLRWAGIELVSEERLFVAMNEHRVASGCDCELSHARPIFASLSDEPLGKRP